MSAAPTIAGCRSSTRDPDAMLSEAYCVLTLLALQVAEQEGRSRVTDSVMAGAIDAAATLVGFAHAEIVR